MYLHLDHLGKHFPPRAQTGTLAAVDDLSLGMNKGEFITPLEPSGCGKTTTLRLIAGFEMPNSSGTPAQIGLIPDLIYLLPAE